MIYNNCYEYNWYTWNDDLFCSVEIRDFLTTEKSDEEGDRIYEELKRIYQNEFFGSHKDDDGNELPVDDITRTSAVFD